MARYQFRLQGHNYQGETRWHERYLNESTAKDAVARLKLESPPVWYDGSNPKISTLEETVPTKREPLYKLFVDPCPIFFGTGLFMLTEDYLPKSVAVNFILEIT